jgi:HlyD family secretion protein
MNKSKILGSVLVVLIMVSCHNENLQNKYEGKVKRETVYLAPKVPGRITSMRVKEGVIVKCSDTLAIIDVPEIEAKMMQAEGAFLAAKAQYQMAMNGATKWERQQVDAKLEAARQQYEFAEKSYHRIKSMLSDSLIAVQKYDEVFEKYMSAKAQFDAATAMKSDVDHGVRPEKLQMAFGDMRRAEGALKEAATAFNERYVLAPKSMTIETISLKQGELSLPGYNLFIGYESEGTYFRFTINEKNIEKFKLGQICSVEVPAMRKNIEAKIVAIKQLASYADKTSSYANYELGEAVYELKLIPQNISEVAVLNANMTILMNR